MSDPRPWIRRDNLSQTIFPIYFQATTQDTLASHKPSVTMQNLSTYDQQQQQQQTFSWNPIIMQSFTDNHYPRDYEHNIMSCNSEMSLNDPLIDTKENRDPRPHKKRSSQDLYAVSSDVSNNTDTSTQKMDTQDQARPQMAVHKGLDLLCAAATEHITSLKTTNRIQLPQNCSCPRSRCLKLYCECFQAGSLCLSSCSCKNCKNTSADTGWNGARTLAVQQILSRNPFAFDSNTGKKFKHKKMEGVACRCTKTRCLKLYCDCFLKGQICDPECCLCINCLNTQAESGTDGLRTAARKSCLEKNPDVFVAKPKAIGSGCSCKNSRYADYTPFPPIDSSIIKPTTNLSSLSLFMPTIS